MSSVLLTPVGQMGFNGTNSFKGGTEMSVQFVIYNSPKDISGLEQRIMLLDEHRKTLMFAPFPQTVLVVSRQHELARRRDSTYLPRVAVMRSW
jgi:hypothetical protein